MQSAVMVAALGVVLFATVVAGVNVTAQEGELAGRHQMRSEENPAARTPALRARRFKEESVTVKAQIGATRHLSSRRPTWGRDFGPIDDMKGAGGVKKETAYQGKELQEESDLDETNPFSKEITEVVIPRPEPDDPQVEEPRYQMRPPPTPEGDEHFSSSDGMDRIRQVQREVANEVRGEHSTLPDPSTFTGKSCEESCTKCYLTVVEVGVDTCKCFTNCNLGTDAKICDIYSRGWRANEQSIPEEEWTASCNYGDVNCDACVSERTKAKVAECDKSTQRKDCLVDALENYEPPAKSPMDNVMYCATKDMETCQRLTEYPAGYKDGDGKDGWRCFRHMEKDDTAEQDCDLWLHPIEDDGPELEKHEPVSVFRSTQQR
eukprot:gnl/TRDRNA2_/TRDRNA2_181984_c0_seq1.p1 gnl/TRDRNA2_/TRDRNA2_181984_c0~~gnl/TRDRNA2_/TRDRNA2_181984_c0_seq1.p1  ORF type:complete len:377 (+),score=55.60 gnl/TRDRNA2_/TRDRNA2_181984_c0_seq1:58-1188(+)